MKRLLNKLRGFWLFSKFARLVLTPVQYATSAIERQIRIKCWINGGDVIYDGIRLSFPIDVGLHYSSNIYWLGTQGFEPNTWKVIKHFVKSADIFVDVGSNIGFYSVLAKKINPSIQIHAFEPIPTICQKNRMFHESNSIHDNKINQIALAEKIGENEIFLPVSDSSGMDEETTATLRVDSWQNRAEEKLTYTIECTTLDAYFLEWIESECSLDIFIKVDVEDFESAVFSGGPQSLSKLRPFIVCELLPREHGNQETLRLILDAGYVFFAITADGLFRLSDYDMYKSRTFTDFLFAPQEKLPDDAGFIPYCSMKEIFSFAANKEQ